LEDGINIDFNYVNVDGSDLRFISNGILLDYEIEKIDSFEAWVWVRLPKKFARSA